MLPGFRFLFAAILLSTSFLVFGLGAAALLRAAHGEFASTPSWRVAPEPTFAQRNQAPEEPLVPVLAVLRVEPEPDEQQTPDNAPPAETTATAPEPDQPETIAVLNAPDETLPEAAKSEIPAMETSVPSEATASLPAPADGAREATAEQALPLAHETVAPAPERAIAPQMIAPEVIAPPAAVAATQGNEVGAPPVAVKTPPATKAADAKADRGAAKKRRQARRAKERRRQAQRARKAAVAQPQFFDPFAQPTVPARSR